MEEIHQSDSATRQELSARELVAILIRFFGIVTLLTIITRFRNLVGILSVGFDAAATPSQSLANVLLTSGSFLVSLIVVAWLWLFPETISSRIVPKEYDGYIRFDLSFREIQALVFSLFGVYLMTQAIPQIARVLGTTLVQYNEFANGTRGVVYVFETYAPIWIEAGTQILLALVLFWWSRRIISWLYLSQDSETQANQ